MFKRSIKQDSEKCDRERIKFDLENRQELTDQMDKKVELEFRKMLLAELSNATTRSEISDIVNSTMRGGMTHLMVACSKGWSGLVQRLLTYPELDVNFNNAAAAFCAVQFNSVECFKELTKCHRIDWNVGNEIHPSVAFYAAHLHRVEMLRALSKVPFNRVNWNVHDEYGDSIAHLAILSTKNSCYQILDILLEVPDFDINQRNQDCQTPLTLALGKRDYRSLMMLFRFTNLELYEPDFDFALESMEDIDILIDECFKSNRETGYNYSDVVDFLTEYKKQARPQCFMRQFFAPPPLDIPEAIMEVVRILEAEKRKKTRVRGI